jgi:hypothetical protein
MVSIFQVKNLLDRLDKSDKEILELKKMCLVLQQRILHIEQENADLKADMQEVEKTFQSQEDAGQLKRI